MWNVRQSHGSTRAASASSWRGKIDGGRAQLVEEHRDGVTMRTRDEPEDAQP